MKKNPTEYEKLQKEYFETVEKKGLSKNLCNYVWNVLVATSRGYGFNASHTLAYSLIALQEMNLAFKFPIIFWNCACLISDSGGTDNEDEFEKDEEFNPYDFDSSEICYNEIEDFFENEDEEDDDEDNSEDDKSKIKKKKKQKTNNYGKIATALGKIKEANIKIVPPNINKSSYTFSPDIQINSIRYGLSGITKVGEDLIKTILNNRPYNSLEDFLSKVKVNKPQMINLIKSGAFDEFGKSRESIMKDYINIISDTKNRLTLSNMKMLIDFSLIPNDLSFERKVYNFNKYIKKPKIDNYYLLDNIAFNFYSKNFDIDNLITYESESGFAISKTIWDKIYKKAMDPVRKFLSINQKDLLKKTNNKIINQLWEKYCSGNISKWEMDSISYYNHEHELFKVDYYINDFSNFFSLPREPQPVTFFVPKNSNRKIPLFNIERICGTVLDKNKNKKTVTLLTKEGIVNVKIFGQVFTNYDKQISQIGADGKKHVIEKSIFTRGNKIIICGIRRDDFFIAKKYSNTPHHLVEQITEVMDDGTIIIKEERGED